MEAYDYEQDVAPATDADPSDFPHHINTKSERMIMLTALRKLTIAGVAALTLTGTMAAGTDTAQAFHGRGGFRGGFGFHGGFHGGFGRFGYGRFGYGGFGFRRFGYGGFGPYGFRRFGFGYPGFYGYGFRRAFFGGPGFYGPFGYGGFYGPRRFFY